MPPRRRRNIQADQDQVQANSSSDHDQDPQPVPQQPEIPLVLPVQPQQPPADALAAILPHLVGADGIDAPVLLRALRRMYGNPRRTRAQTVITENVRSLQIDQDPDSPFCVCFVEPGALRPRRGGSPWLAFEAEFFLHMLSRLVADADQDDDDPSIPLSDICRLIDTRIRLLTSIAEGSLSLNQAIASTHEQWKWKPEIAWPTSHINRSFVQKNRRRGQSREPSKGGSKSRKYLVSCQAAMNTNLDEPEYFLPGIPSDPPHWHHDSVLIDHLRVWRTINHRYRGDTELPAGLEPLLFDPDTTDSSWRPCDTIRTAELTPESIRSSLPTLPKRLAGHIHRKRYYSAWKSIFAHPAALKIIRDGVSIIWASSGPPTHVISRSNNPSCSKHPDFVTQEVKGLLDSGAAIHIGEAQRRWPGFEVRVISGLGVAEGRKLRLVLDLTSINDYMIDIPFKYESMDQAAASTRGNRVAVTIDLKSGYHQVAMRPDAVPFLGFRWQKRTYVFVALPFGSKQAPFFFSLLTHQAVRYARVKGAALSHYLDDFLLSELSSSRLLVDLAAWLRLLNNLGWLTHPVKIVITPTPKVVFRGLELDLTAGVWRVPVAKAGQVVPMLAQAAAAPGITFNDAEVLAGKLVSLSPALIYARFHASAFYTALHRMRHSGSSWTMWTDLERAHIQSACRRIPGACRRFRQLDGRVAIYTDASDLAWGGLLLPKMATAAGNWSKDVTELRHITWKELCAFKMTSEEVAPHINSTKIVWATDSIAAAAAIRHLGGGSSELASLAADIWSWWIERDCDLYATWIPGKHNEPADALSRGLPLRHGLLRALRDLKPSGAHAQPMAELGQGWPTLAHPRPASPIDSHPS
eukprot:gnl/Dysnectes_brevis/1271_a1425_1193.p1 GENE.gnl/Dysnectes_brevis/1271_a1425_1193~~gnl/Dysnectes_brevis/1271_a1425_1193.p1  ORF type:complete len:863 (+),score=112.03 gnl/Dysnectes_brevis/1271_a1425_1193:230-2818(+)